MDSDEETSANGQQGQIFCLEWVKRQKCQINVDKVKLTKKELEEILEGEAKQGSKKEVDEDEEQEVKKEENADDDLAQFNFDDYSDEESPVQKFSDFYMPSSNDNDDSDPEDFSESEDEKEDLVLKPDDNLMICARCKPDSSCLEVNVYNHESKDFYIHHHIDLDNSRPLCLKWLDFDIGFDGENPGQSDSGSFLAVGTLESVIEIWDLNVINQMEPDFILGQDVSQQEGSCTKTCHQNAVLDLAWSPYKRKRILSASADKTVALWDLEKGSIVRRYRRHREKVQTIAFRKSSADHLLSGAFNGTIFLFDIRTKCMSTTEVPSWKLNEEVERVCWMPDDNHFVASTDQGNIYYFDSRKPMESLYSWKAHDMAIPGLGSTPNGELYSASSDGFLKNWTLTDTKQVENKSMNMKMGMVHCISFNPDVPNMLTVGGEKQGIRMLDVDNLKNEETTTNKKKNSQPDEDGETSPKEPKKKRKKLSHSARNRLKQKKEKE